MSELVVEQPGGLSEVARVVDVFVAPSKTFADIRRKATWLVPILVMLVVGLFFTYTIDKKVGFDSVAQKQIEQSPMAADQMAAMPAADRAHAVQQRTTVTRYISYSFIVIILIWGSLMALLYWMSMNFVMGASTKFKDVFAMWMYGSLPLTVKSFFAACVLWAGVGTETFDIKNPLGTNPAYYLQDAGAAVKAALGFIDIFSLWSLLLMVIGLSVLSGKTKGQAAIVVFGWWLFGLGISTALAAVFG